MITSLNNKGRTGVATLLCQYADSPSITYWSIMKRKEHRLVWESVNGPIPKDENNRTYEIHHIDGNHKNNSIENLKLVTIQEHYDIHYSQGDWNACLLISLRLNKSPEEISSLSSAAAKERIKNGTHHFLKGGPREDLKGDKNPMRNPEIAKKLSIATKGKPKTLESKEKMRVAAKKRPCITCEYCNLLVNKLNYSKWHGSKCLQNPNKDISPRITNFTKNNPNNKKKICEHCKIECSLPNYNRWHGKNCRRKT